MDFKFILFFIQLTAIAKAHLIRIKNNCSFTVWPGIQGDPEHEHLLNGGFALDGFKTHTFNTPRNWAGRIWGRTNCDSQGKCETGDCGKSIIWSICNRPYILSEKRCQYSKDIILIAVKPKSINCLFFSMRTKTANSYCALVP